MSLKQDLQKTIDSGQKLIEALKIAHENLVKCQTENSILRNANEGLIESLNTTSNRLNAFEAIGTKMLYDTVDPLDQADWTNIYNDLAVLLPTVEALVQQKIEAVGAPQEIERITVAAMRLPGGAIWTMPRPNRHHDLMRPLHISIANSSEEGFLTSTRRYVSRTEAAAIARAAGQIPPANIKKRCDPQDQLFTEDLW